MTDEFAIKILEQYREKPTLINEIETVEEAVWLDEALAMGIKALKQEPVLDKIRAEISEYGSIMVSYAITKDTKTDKGIQKLVGDILHQAKEEVLEIIDKYKAETETEDGNDTTNTGSN